MEDLMQTKPLKFKAHSCSGIIPVPIQNMPLFTIQLNEHKVSYLDKNT